MELTRSGTRTARREDAFGLGVLGDVVTTWQNLKVPGGGLKRKGLVAKDEGTWGRGIFFGGGGIGTGEWAGGLLRCGGDGVVATALAEIGRCD